MKLKQLLKAINAKEIRIRYYTDTATRYAYKENTINLGQPQLSEFNENKVLGICPIAEGIIELSLDLGD